MGISILSGTITSLGCGSALYGGETTIFQKFAIIITTTITMSFLAAMLLFGALCHTVGPQDDVGNIYRCFKKKHQQDDDAPNGSSVQDEKQEMSK